LIGHSSIRSSSAIRQRPSSERSAMSLKTTGSWIDTYRVTFRVCVSSASKASRGSEVRETIHSSFGGPLRHRFASAFYLSVIKSCSLVNCDGIVQIPTTINVKLTEAHKYLICIKYNIEHILFICASASRNVTAPFGSFLSFN